jgi:hypothetical protein
MGKSWGGFRGIYLYGFITKLSVREDMVAESLLALDLVANLDLTD